MCSEMLALPVHMLRQVEGWRMTGRALLSDGRFTYHFLSREEGPGGGRARDWAPFKAGGFLQNAPKSASLTYPGMLRR